MRRGIRIAMIVLLGSLLFLSNACAQDDFEVSLPLQMQVLDALENLLPSQKLVVHVGTDKERYHVGEPIEVRFQANYDCYIVLMRIAADGTISFFIPSQQAEKNRFKAKRVYSTVHDLKITIPASSTSGTEVINLFCSFKKIDFFTTNFKKEPIYTIPPTDEIRLKQLLEHLNQLKKYEWSGNSAILPIEAAPKPKMRSLRIAPVEQEVMFFQKLGALPPIDSVGTTGRWFPPIDTTGTTGKTDTP